MKKTVRYEVRWGYMQIYSSDNMFKSLEVYDERIKSGIHATIHEITTIEKDITETAKIEKDGLE